MIGVKYGEAFQRTQINFGGVDFFGFVGTIGAGDELRGGTARDIGFENVVRVVEIGKDDVEFGKILHEVFGELAASREKSGQRAGFDGLRAVNEAAGFGELDD